VGEKTGGSPDGPTAGLLFTVKLPNSDVRARLPFFRIYNNVDMREAGVGISPDIYVPITIADFVAEQDATLNRALAIINQQK